MIGAASAGSSLTSPPGSPRTTSVSEAHAQPADVAPHCPYLIPSPNGPRCWLDETTPSRCLTRAFDAAVSLLHDVAESQVVGRDGEVVAVLIDADLWESLPWSR
jgi:hypothetical protein